MTSDYVAGSLSALFGKKSSKTEGSGPIQLKHVKQMYEEFTPQKAPREIGHRQQLAIKRKSSEETVTVDKRQKFSQDERVPAKKGIKKEKEVKKTSFVEYNRTSKPEEAPDGDNQEIDGDLTNKQAALKRIKRKNSAKKQKEEKHDSKEENTRDFRYYEDDPTYIPQTIFVKNLPPKTQRKHMKKLFAECGEILFVRFVNAVPAKAGIPVEAAIKKRSLIKEGTSISAFVVFKDVASVQAALGLNGIDYDGHHLRVDRREASNIPAKRSVFCGNIAFDTTDDELWQFFEEAGAIDYVRVVRDNVTGSGKGIAFVVFKEASAAALALEFSSKEFKGRVIRVTAVEKRRAALPSSKSAQVTGSKEKINKRKMEKKSMKQEFELKGAPRKSKQKKEEIKKTIKRDKLKRVKKQFAKKLLGNKS